MADKPYMPLMMGDWIRGTRAMKAEVKGVYIGLLIHQYDQGYLPADMETLALIEPEVVKVWVLLKDKFEEFEPGKLRNKKLEEVRSFWDKQRKNGKNGGRPKKENPKRNPNNNPNTNHHNDLDNDIDLEKKVNKVYSKNEIKENIFGDKILYGELKRMYAGVNLLQAFDECYIHHSNAPNPPQETWEWRQKFNTWLTFKAKDNGNDRRTTQKTTAGTRPKFSGDYSQPL